MVTNAKAAPQYSKVLFAPLARAAVACCKSNCSLDKIGRKESCSTRCLSVFSEFNGDARHDVSYLSRCLGPAMSFEMVSTMHAHATLFGTQWFRVDLPEDYKNVHGQRSQLNSSFCSYAFWPLDAASAKPCMGFWYMDTQCKKNCYSARVCGVSLDAISWSC